MPNIEFNNELVQKYSHLTRTINEEFINIHPIQRGGILTPEAYKALISYGDGYSLCDNCLKGRLDQIENPPVVDFLSDMAAFLGTDNVMPTAAARESKRLVMEALSKKYHERKTVVVDSTAHYTTYLAIENNNLSVKEVPNAGHPTHEIDPLDYEDVIKNVIDEEGQPPLLAVLTHVDYKYGNFNEPKPVGDICKNLGVPFLLNAAYSGGVLPIDCKTGNIDFVTCSGHKSMAASGPIGVLGFSNDFFEDIMVNSRIEGNLTSKSFHNKICTVMGCPPVYGAPLLTLMASFPELVRRTQPDQVEEESKKANYVVDEIKKIKGMEVLGKLPKIHPLTAIRTDSFSEIAQNHPRKGFFVRDEFKERGIIGMAPGISKNMKFSTYGLTWEQVKYFAEVFLDIAKKYNILR